MENFQIEQGGAGGAAGAGGGQAGPPTLQQRLQDLVDDLRGEINGCRVLQMVGFVLLLVVAISFVAWKRENSHHHPHTAALWCQPNATVSPGGGHGAFSSISGAVQAAPSFSGARYCIHIKGGRYTENVVVPEEKTNIVFVGDGIEKTTIVANRTCGAQHCELQIGTLWVKGSGFIAVDLTVENNEDPVALATAAVDNWSDRSVFYRCSFRSRHEAVRASKQRQFYRDCSFHGTGSLVYGGAQAYFQNCAMTIDGTVKNVIYTVAEQSREYATIAGGFVFHLCDVAAVGDPTSKPLLGAALTRFATIVYMECVIRIQEAGWSNNGFTEGTVFFAEYGNTGVGAAQNTSSADLHLLDAISASQFSLRSFFPEDWVPGDVPHKLAVGS